MKCVFGLGIDLGTTYSVVAAIDAAGVPRVLDNRDGESLTPSVVYFDGEKPIIGSAAVVAGGVTPQNCIELVKRHIGDTSWKHCTISGTQYTAEQISAILLRRLADDAALALGQPCSEVVITVPAYFDDARRRATADAGIIAGLDVLSVLNEPTAAALAYGFGRGATSSHVPATVLVYDWGGGTFDATVVRIHDDEYTVLATAGDRNLGGFDIDNAVMLHVDSCVVAQGGPSSLDSDVAELLLRGRCEQAKRALSSVPETLITVDCGAVSYPVHLARPTFANLTAPLLRRTEEIVAEVIIDAGVQAGDLSVALLVGGSTRAPMVSRMLQRVTGVPVRQDVHPEQAVALGAALVAASASAARRGVVSREYKAAPFAGQHITNRLVVHDVTAHSLGLIARCSQTGAEINSVLIRRNTPLPAQGRQRFHTLAENQREILVVITQGEDPDPRYITIVGSARMPVPPSEESVEVEVLIGYDEQGLIGVRVADPHTGVPLGEFSIDRQANVDVQEIERMRQSLQTLNTRK